MSFLAELKRRRVFRVAGAYLVVAWIALQVTSTLVPALHLPGWVITLVAVLLIAGFPVALVLGWVFDVTPGGIERTTMDTRFAFPARAATAGTLIVTLGVAGFLIVRRRANAAGVDPNSVVVLPFRVSGNAELANMREGMVDLIVPKLTGVGGPRAVDSRTTLSAWRAALPSESDDLAPNDAIKLARKLKAGHVLLGEVVGTPGRITLTARTYSTIDGGASDPVDVSITQDSMLAGVDHLVAELLTQQAGETDRLASLLSSSLPAVQSFLDGRRNYRRGKYVDAAQHFERALELDSTFALAAVGNMLSRDWTGFGPEWVRSRRLAFQYKDRLPLRDREYLIAKIGENFPAPQSYLGSIRAWETLSSKYPDSPDVWFELGDHYFHYGNIAGIAEPHTRAHAAWTKATSLDPTYSPAWEHQIELHARRGDTASLREVRAQLVRLGSEEIDSEIGLTYALAMNNDTLRTRLLSEMPTWTSASRFDAVNMIVANGLDLSATDSIMRTAVNAASNDAQRASANDRSGSYWLMRGRPRAALAALRSYQELRTVPAARAILRLSILYPELDRSATEQAAQIVRADASPVSAQVIAIWDGLQGRTETIETSLQLMRDSLQRQPEWSGRYNYTRALLEAIRAIGLRQPNALQALARVDSLIVNGPMIGGSEVNFGGILLARLYAQAGDHGRAYAAVKRQDYAGFFFGAYQLERARQAALAGHKEDAINAYRLYLNARDPEPGIATDITNKARAELNALLGKQ